METSNYYPQEDRPYEAQIKRANQEDKAAAKELIDVIHQALAMQFTENDEIHRAAAGPVSNIDRDVLKYLRDGFALASGGISLDLAFGVLTRTRGRKPQDDTARDLEIALYVQNLKERGLTLTDAKIRASQRFRLSKKTIDAIWQSRTEERTAIVAAIDRNLDKRQKKMLSLKKRSKLDRLESLKRHINCQLK